MTNGWLLTDEISTSEDTQNRESTPDTQDSYEEGDSYVFNNHVLLFPNEFIVTEDLSQLKHCHQSLQEFHRDKSDVFDDFIDFWRSCFDDDDNKEGFQTLAKTQDYLQKSMKSVFETYRGKFYFEDVIVKNGLVWASGRQFRKPLVYALVGIYIMRDDGIQIFMHVLRDNVLKSMMRNAFHNIKKRELIFIDDY